MPRHGFTKSIWAIYCIAVFASSYAPVLAQEEALQKAAPVLEEAVAVLSDNSGTAISEREADRARLVQGGAEENGQIAEIEMEIRAGTVLVMTLLMAGAAGLGTIPFFFTGKLSKEVAALANAVACGVMIACSFDLIHEGQPYGANLVIAGVVLGAIFISASQQWLEQFEEVRFQGLQGINARKILLMIGIMAAHAFGEGAGVGVSFCGSRGWAQGVLVTLAIGLHNIPEGLAVSTVLVGRGIQPRTALLWTLFTALPQPLVAVPSFLFVDAFRVLLPLALGFAAGCMVWMVFAELLPDALADAPHGKVATVGTFSAASLEGLRMLLSGLEGGGGKIALPVALNASNLAAEALLLLPAVVSGAVIANLGNYMPKEKSALLGLAAGLLSWQGLSALAEIVMQPEKPGLLPTLASFVFGAISIVVIRTVTQLQTKGSPQKEKTGDTPTKNKAGVVIAANQLPTNGHREAVDLDDMESGRGHKGKVFEPYRYSEHIQGDLVAAIAASVVISLSEGMHTAKMKQVGRPQLSSVWLALAIRACISGLVPAALLQRRCSHRVLVPLVAVLACVAPAATGFVRLRAELGVATPNAIGCYLPGAAAGAALTAGWWVLWPLARKGGWRRESLAICEGIFFGLLATVMLSYLCWQFGNCL